MAKKIVIKLEGGLIQIIQMPTALKDVEVEIHEYSKDEVAAVPSYQLCEDEEGKEYYPFQYDYREIEQDDSVTIGDSTAMDEILKILQEPEWSPDSIEQVCEIVRMTNRHHDAEESEGESS
jgi:hypothetical protein